MGASVFEGCDVFIAVSAEVGFVARGPGLSMPFCQGRELLKIT